MFNIQGTCATVYSQAVSMLHKMSATYYLLTKNIGLSVKFADIFDI